MTDHERQELASRAVTPEKLEPYARLGFSAASTTEQWEEISSARRRAYVRCARLIIAAYYHQHRCPVSAPYEIYREEMAAAGDVSIPRYGSEPVNGHWWMVFGGAILDAVFPPVPA